ncbi:MAG: peptidyl-alpha-hydroxyglycine alpha-amidating lyase family protein [Dehalococcoidia bacterium]
MVTTVGSGAYTYEAIVDWHHLPDGMRLHETPGVAVDAQDQVYILTRNVENPVIVFDRQGNFLRMFGKGHFTERSHGITIGPDGMVYCTDDGTHTITKWTPAGELLMTIGTPYKPAEAWSGEPFCRPTQAVISRHTGHIYISDGYSNARIHKYTPNGKLVKSWGEPGIDAGQFMIPHNLDIDAQDRIYVADRQAHRVQVFDNEGNFIAMWNNIHLPCALRVGPDGNIYIGELCGSGLTGNVPGYGHRVGVYSPDGQMLARFGDPVLGEGPGQFIAPHGIAIDSHGDIYVGEVSWTMHGRTLNPPQELRSLSKLRRIA